MTIATSSSIAIGRGNGATTQFAYGFLIPAAEFAVVTLTTPAGVQSVLPASAYTLVGAGNPDGGHVDYPLFGPPLANGYTLTTQRVIPFTQPTSLKNQGGFYPETVEAAIDWLAMQIQQGIAQINTGIHYPQIDLNPVSQLPPAAARAGKFFGFDGNGNPAMLNGNLLAGDLLPYTLGGAVFTNPGYASMNVINMNAGWYLEYNTAVPTIAQVLSIHVERTAGAGLQYLVGGMISVQNRAGVSSDIFGIVTETINQPGATGGLIGAEFAVANETANCVNAKIACNVVFKNRGDGVAAAPQGLGANSYNLGAQGLYISSQSRSTSGEFCGFRRGIYFDPEAIDADINGGGIGIDFAKVHYYGGANPLTAYRMTAAIRLRDFQSILWNGDPTLPNDPTEPTANAVRTFFNSSTGRLTISTGGVDKWGVDVSTGDMYKAGVLITPVSTASNNTWTGTNTFNNTFTLGTDLNFSGARKIAGDFTNATLANRVTVQSSTVNGATDIIAMPNGTSTSASWNLFNAAGLANCAFGRIAISNGEVSIQSSQIGAGAALPLTFYCGAGGSAERMRVSTSGQVLINTTTDSAVPGAKLRVAGIPVFDNTCSFMANTGGAAFVFANTTFSLVPFNTETFDENNSFDTTTYRYTPPAGKYRLTASAGLTGGVDQARLYVAIYKNGVVHLAGSTTASGAVAHGASVSGVVIANGIDYFEVYVWQNSGGNETLSGNAQDTYFCGERIG